VKRREFIALLGGAVVAWPLAARAQQTGRTYRLGVLHNLGPQSPMFPPFYDELRRLGFVEGQNLIVDSRGYAVRTEQFPAVAAELVKAQVDAILAGGTAAARAAQVATRTIPILTLNDDMVGQGLVASLARPGGNITGISILATELDGKRQEILMEMVPAARRMPVRADANTAAPQNMRTLQEAAGCAAWTLPSVWSSGLSGSCRKSRRRDVRAPKRSTCWPPRSSMRVASTFLSARLRCAYRPCTSRRSLLRRVD
jgi:putative ABC transport system substrate-binding protein